MRLRHPAATAYSRCDQPNSTPTSVSSGGPNSMARLVGTNPARATAMEIVEDRPNRSGALKAIEKALRAADAWHSLLLEPRNLTLGTNPTSPPSGLIC